MLFIIGAGGHAKIALATAAAVGMPIAGLLDDDLASQGKYLWGHRVIGPISELAHGSHAFIAIGDNRVRKALGLRLTNRVEWVTLIHPSSIIDKSVTIGKGNLIAAGVVVQPDAAIGNHVILNTSCSVDHDSVIGDYVHIAPGAVLTGSVRVGEGCLVGARSVLLPGCMVGSWSTVGAGAVVVRDLPSGVVAKGIPAKI